ncbi:hypothetical protein T8K17_25750 (plasmid) [Thalassobaculum sp. OXR-137]|uniref:hypothetical protein n=1 Tax=Thalassobaculum sp. OXR-137 TaxID=3100173 RepID=UPI002AC970EF|nr:hypothetical protein [Thalassobaculum sp. OXR-137]WPZ37133.1 hypothetical protein T8K17_25750 [Thalassobaculum sp. OXR-137]
MPSVAMGFALNLLLAFQLFHPFLFSRGLLRDVPFLGLTALAQRGCTRSKLVRIYSRRCLAQTRRQIRRSLPLLHINVPFLFTALPRLPCVPQPRGKVRLLLSAITPPRKRQLGLSRS